MKNVLAKGIDENTHFTVPEHNYTLDKFVTLLLSRSQLEREQEEQPELTAHMLKLCKSTIKQAWGTEKDASSQYRLQKSLFAIYQAALAEPLSNESRNQFNPVMLEIKRQIEQAWLCAEGQRHLPVPTIRDAADFCDKLKGLWQQHTASQHALYDYLHQEASLDQLRYFFKSDSALNLVFFDLIALAMLGSRQEIRGELSRNMWDEC